jgi:hypothetical protein
MKNLELLTPRRKHFLAYNYCMRDKNTVFHTFGDLYEDVVCKDVLEK